MLNWMSTLHLHTFDESKPTPPGGQRETSEMHKAFMNVREVQREKANSVSCPSVAVTMVIYVHLRNS